MVKSIFQVLSLIVSIALYSDTSGPVFAASIDNNSTVILVSTVFRHGDRTPALNTNETFPTDIYQGSSFYPDGVGQLTIAGKQRAYRLGQMLRKRYDELLGPVYIQEALTARSTAIIRSKMTLLLVLAALYPPGPIQRWNPKLNWQPINTVNMPLMQDGLLLPFACPPYLEARKELDNDEELQKKISKYDPLLEKLSVETGKNMTSIQDLYMLYHTLYARSMMKLKLPSWSKGIFPYGALRDATVLQYQINSYNTVLKRRNGGILLRKMIEDMRIKMDGQDPSMKIHLYCAQEITVASLLSTLGVFNDIAPTYCSTVTLELHLKQEKYYVKVLYYYGIPEKTVEMQIPGCDVLCPFDEFIALTTDVIPWGSELQCDLPVPSEL